MQLGLGRENMAYQINMADAWHGLPDFQLQPIYLSSNSANHVISCSTKAFKYPTKEIVHS